jgi:hypothetical protein
LKLCIVTGFAAYPEKAMLKPAALQQRLKTLPEDAT